MWFTFKYNKYCRYSTSILLKITRFHCNMFFVLLTAVMTSLTPTDSKTQQSDAVTQSIFCDKYLIMLGISHYKALFLKCIIFRGDLWKFQQR